MSKRSKEWAEYVRLREAEWARGEPARQLRARQRENAGMLAAAVRKMVLTIRTPEFMRAYHDALLGKPLRWQ